MEGPVGFIGAGAMGGPMIARLTKAGFSVLVHDAAPGRAAAAAGAAGAAAAASLEELSSAPIVICMLPNSAVVDAVVADLLRVLRPGSLIIDMGSSIPEHTTRLAATVGASGSDLVDAPVSGGVARAVTGELTVMFGGTNQQFERARPLLAAVGAQLVQVGPVGSGHALKSLNNLLSAIGLTAAAEVVEVGRRYGLDPRVMLEVINTSTGRNHATETKIEQHVLSERYASGFLLQLMLKDVGIAIELARSQGVSTPLGDACLARWQEAGGKLPANADQTEIARLNREGL